LIIIKVLVLNYIENIRILKTDFFFKDLEGIGRDLNKICIVDNNKKNFELQNENGIEIKEFLGDGNDKELNFLMEEFKKIIEIDKKNNIEDIRPYIININNNMQKRYKNDINNNNNNILQNENIN
jgi:hypothetical protein